MRLIDADALWDEMQKNYTDGDCGDKDRLNIGINLGITKSYHCLASAPTIDARSTDIANAYTSGYVEGAVNEALKRKKGGWIVSHGVFAHDGIYGDMWHCSECGLSERDVEGKNFCWNCGADMRGDADV